MTVRRESHPGVGAAPSGSRTDQWSRPGHGPLVLNRRMFASLAHRDFRYLWTGNLAAMFAMQMQMVARGWLIFAMTERWQPMVVYQWNRQRFADRQVRCSQTLRARVQALR